MKEVKHPHSSSTPSRGKRPPPSPTSPSTTEEEETPRSPAPLLTADAVIGTEGRRLTLITEASDSSRSRGAPVDKGMSTILTEIGKKQGVSSPKNPGIGTSTMGEQAKRQSRPIFNSLHADNLVERKEWDTLEAYLMEFIPSSNALEIHPMLFLSIRMSRVIHLIDNDNFAAAAEYYQNHMRRTFQEIIDQGQGVLRNANVDDLTNGLKHINKCLGAMKSLPHLYTSNLMTKTLVNDYMRLYLPNEIGYILQKKKDDLWFFGFPLKSKSSSKPTFRCLACSVKVFSSGTIKDIAMHLKVCPRMNTMYVSELFDHYMSLKDYFATQSEVQKPLQVKKSATKRPGPSLSVKVQQSATKRPRIDSTQSAAPSISVEKQDILDNILVEIESAEHLHGSIEQEVDEVIELHNTMGAKVTKIVEMHGKMGVIVKNLKGLACPGPSVPDTVLGPIDSAAMEEEEEGSRGEQNKVEQVKEPEPSSAALSRFDINYLTDELRAEMQMNPPDPTSDLMSADELAESFLDMDAADNLFP